MAACQSFVLTWSAEVIFNASNIIHEILYIICTQNKMQALQGNIKINSFFNSFVP